MPVTDATRLRNGVRRSDARGFTLAELAIVVAVIALLLGGLTLTLSTQTELRRISDTQRTLELVKDALIGFAMTRGRFPCPANPTEGPGATNLGKERAVCTSTDQYGALPWVTLGVPETDAWGRRFSYRVSSDFADQDSISVGGCPPPPPPNEYPTKSSFMLCSQGNIRVQTRNPNRTLQTLADTLPVIVISHGANGFRAYQPDGTQLPAPPGEDEAANANPALVNFIVREVNRGAPGCHDATAGTPLCEFDDLVSWVPLPVLMNRMVASGKLPY
jgi:prepilin-type N-terminal cleavage/methylation domain-containing protein